VTGVIAGVRVTGLRHRQDGPIRISESSVVIGRLIFDVVKLNVLDGDPIFQLVLQDDSL
jgi:hypothetical protein